MTDIAYRNLGDADKIKDCLDKIKTASHHLLSLINDVLDITFNLPPYTVCPKAIESVSPLIVRSTEERPLIGK